MLAECLRLGGSFIANSHSVYAANLMKLSNLETDPWYSWHAPSRTFVNRSITLDDVVGAANDECRRERFVSPVEDRVGYPEGRISDQDQRCSPCLEI